MEQNLHIIIKDNKGKENIWVVESETTNTYNIFCDGFVSAIRKSDVYINGAELYSDEVRNAYCTIEDSNYAKANFCEIKLDKAYVNYKNNLYVQK